MLEVKDVNGNPVSVTGRGQGIYNTVGASAGLLALLQNGVLGGNGILSGNGNIPAANAMSVATETLANVRNIAGCCFLDKDVFWQTMLNQANENANRDIAIERRFAALESAQATSAAVGACNTAAINREFDVVDQRFRDEARYDDLSLRYAISTAMCGTIKGETMLPFSKLGSSYIDKTHVIDTYEARPFREPRHDGWHDGCSPCGGYRGF